MAKAKKKGLRGTLQQIFFWEILQGLKLTFKQMFTKPITMRYPEQKWVMSPRFRGQVALVRDPKTPDRDLCVGCCLCVRTCPAEALDMVTSMDEKTGQKRVDDHIYSLSRCIFCGLCVDVCPVRALVNTQNYELATYNRKDMILDKEQLLEVGRNWQKQMAEQKSQNITPQTVVSGSIRK